MCKNEIETCRVVFLKYFPKPARPPRRTSQRAGIHATAMGLLSSVEIKPPRCRTVTPSSPCGSSFVSRVLRRRLGPWHQTMSPSPKPAPPAFGATPAVAPRSRVRAFIYLPHHVIHKER